MNRALTTLLIGFGGIGVGAILVVGLRLLAPQHAKAATLAAEPVAAVAPADTSRLEGRLERLETQQTRAAPVATASGTAAVAAPAPAPTQTPEEAQAEWIGRGAARQAQLAVEPRDAAWSKKTTERFQKEFSQLGAAAHFTVADLDCKTTSCMAKLRWDSYRDAESSWRDVMHAPYATRCAREVFTPVPTAGEMDKPYEASVFFDCIEDRAAQ